MAGVVNKFFITSLIMWAAPVAILYAFNHSLIPGELSLIFLIQILLYKRLHMTVDGHPKVGIDWF